jgi:hypothetical protein
LVYDGVGKDTFMGSLDCLRPRGLLVSFGQSSGNVPPFDVVILSAKGSLFLTRPTVFHYAATKEAMRSMASDLFGVVSSGAVRIEVPQTFPRRSRPRPSSPRRSPHHGLDGPCALTRYLDLLSPPSARVGQEVSAGDLRRAS